MFNEHIAQGKEPSAFNPLLTSGALKPRIPEFVLTGKAALETPEMRAAIQKSFREDGLFEIMQQPERVAAAKRELLESGEFLVDLAITDDVEIDEI